MILWILICGHALADYPLQGEFLAKGKNETAPIPGIPWQWPLVMHALIHAGVVTLITQSVLLGLCELVAHVIIDRGKCRGHFGFSSDQLLHLMCKYLWWVAWNGGDLLK